MKKNNGLTPLNKIIYLFIVVITFGFVFVVLVNKQQGNKLGDVVANDYFQTEYNKRIVVEDLDSIYKKLYVIYFYDDMYELHTFNYYNTISQFDLEFNRSLNNIVDYNRKENMIRTYDLRGIGSYSYVMSNIETIVGTRNIRVY